MAQPVFDFVVYGRPVSKKNSKEIIWKGKRPSIISSKAVRKWELSAKAQLMIQRPREVIEGDLYVEVFSYLTGSQRADLDNLAAAPLDSLESAGIISNDYQFSEMYAIRLRDPDCPRVVLRVRQRGIGDRRSDPITTEPKLILEPM